MLHFPEKIFEVCIYVQFYDHQIVKDAQILFSGRDLQKKIPFASIYVIIEEAPKKSTA